MGGARVALRYAAVTSLMWLATGCATTGWSRQWVVFARDGRGVFGSPTVPITDSEEANPIIAAGCVMPLGSGDDHATPVDEELEPYVAVWGRGARILATNGHLPLYEVLGEVDGHVLGPELGGTGEWVVVRPSDVTSRPPPPNPTHRDAYVGEIKNCPADGSGACTIVTEECDDGNAALGDGCAPDGRTETGYACEPLAGWGPSHCRRIMCGDGFVDADPRRPAAERETCDDGNQSPGDGCDARCHEERMDGWVCGPLLADPAGHLCAVQTCRRTCGNGVLDPGEACDSADPGCIYCRPYTGWTCDTNGRCTELTCGDTVISGREACDDGNTVGADGCSADCSTIETGYACPRVPGGGTSPCVAEPAAVAGPNCGDGNLDSGEVCDRLGDPGCDASCHAAAGWLCDRPGLPCRQPVCRDGVIEGEEECDGGPNDPALGCGDDCLVDPGWKCRESVAAGASVCSFCGNGVVEPGEACEPTGDRDPACSRFCVLVHPCGNGVLDAGEECDPGLDASCTSACMRPRASPPPFLALHTRDGALSLGVHAACDTDGNPTCEPTDLEWLGDVAYYWRPDLQASAGANVSVVYDPDTASAGFGGRLTPLLRRVADGGFGIGFTLAYADVSVRQRFLIAATVAYDITYPLRREIGGRNRNFQLAIGLDAGLAVGGNPTPFDMQALTFGFGLDPFAEARFLPAPDVGLTLRFGTVHVVAANVATFLDASVGLVVAW